METNHEKTIRKNLECGTFYITTGLDTTNQCHEKQQKVRKLFQLDKVFQSQQ